jgi:hypothetical protein
MFQKDLCEVFVQLSLLLSHAKNWITCDFSPYHHRPQPNESLYTHHGAKIHTRSKKYETTFHNKILQHKNLLFHVCLIGRGGHLWEVSKAIKCPPTSSMDYGHKKMHWVYSWTKNVNVVNSYNFLEKIHDSSKDTHTLLKPHNNPNYRGKKHKPIK